MKEASSWSRCFRRPVPLALVWLLVPVFGLVIRLGVEPISPYDYWWHLVMGRIIVEQGVLPSSNLFLYTLEVEAGFHNQPWLGQSMMYWIYEGMGHAGLLAIRNCIAACTWLGVILIALRRGADARIVGGCALAVVVIGGPVFGVRTQMFAFLPYVLLLAIVIGVADGRVSKHLLWLLVPVTAFWANVHGTFILVPILIGVVGGGLALEELLEDGRINWAQFLYWTAAGVGAAVAAFANPHGPTIYGYVLELAVHSEVSASVSEWQPPDISTGFGAAVGLVFAGGWAVLVMRRGRVRVWEASLFLVVTYLGLSSVRSLFWWGAVMLVVVAPHFGALLKLSEESEQSLTSRTQGRVHVAVLAALLLLAVLAQPGLPIQRLGTDFADLEGRRTGTGVGLLTRHNAVDLVRKMAELGYPGHIFHYQGIGGLLEFELTRAERPVQVAFVDQRIELIPESVWDEYFVLSGAEAGWEEVARRYGIETMLLMADEQWGLVQALESHPEWQLVAVDEAHLLYFAAQASEELTRWRSKPTGTRTVP